MFDVSFVFLVFYVVLLLFFVLFPPKRKGVLNLTFGLVGIAVAVGSFALSGLPFAPFTNVVVGVLSVVCLLVGDRDLL